MNPLRLHATLWRVALLAVALLIGLCFAGDADTAALSAEAERENMEASR